ncbi:MAG TPA: VanZ family protein, partial [Enterovirga sp.]
AWLWKRRLWMLGGFAFVAWVVYLSLTPDPWRAPTVDNFKSGHIIAYLWLMLWFAQLWVQVSRRLVVAVLLCLLGVALEYAQALTEYRTFAYSDMVDNAIGVAMGFLLSFTPLGRIGAVLERRRRAR